MKKRTKVFLIILGIIVFLAIVATGLIHINKSNNILLSESEEQVKVISLLPGIGFMDSECGICQTYYLIVENNDGSRASYERGYIDLLYFNPGDTIYVKTSVMRSGLGITYERYTFSFVPTLTQ